MPDDLPDASALAPYDGVPVNVQETVSQEMQQRLISTQSSASAVCLSYTGFYTTFMTLLIALAISSLSATLMYLKLQRIQYKKGHHSSNFS
jgi:hypothetical protein